jgi:hypothetical protein
MRDAMVTMTQEQYNEQLAECQRINELVSKKPDGALALAIRHARWEDTIFSLNKHGEIELDGRMLTIETTIKTKSNESTESQPE